MHKCLMTSTQTRNFWRIMENEELEISYLAHMLDETKHQSYYEVYMLQHPKDKQDILLDLLIGEFAKCLKDNHIDVSKLVHRGIVDDDVLEEMQEKIAYKYVWEKIPAQVYAAIISRYVAMLDAAHGQQYVSELDYENVRRGVSRRTIEDCLDIICHNTNVLSANNIIMVDGTHTGFKRTRKLFQKHGIPMMSYYSMIFDEVIDGYGPIVDLYKAWASYGKGKAGEKYVCDSDNGPSMLKNILNGVEHDADEIQLITTLNKAVDVVHFRSDLANAFLEGGQRTATLVSNLPDKFVI